MKGSNSWRKCSFIVLTLLLNLWGCAQTPAIIIDDNVNYRQHEEMIMVPEQSGHSTDESLRMDMEGGG